MLGHPVNGHTCCQISSSSSLRTCWDTRLCGQDVGSEVISDPTDVAAARTNWVGAGTCRWTCGWSLNDVRVVFARWTSAAQSNCWRKKWVDVTCAIVSLILKHLLTQHTPNPLAQLPSLVPPLAEHSSLKYIQYTHYTTVFTICYLHPYIQQHRKCDWTLALVCT